MDPTLLRAGRNTHLKIVAVALVAAVAVVVVGINARVDNLATANAPSTIKAGQPATFAVQEGSTIR
jgi:hypothetical protein